MKISELLISVLLLPLSMGTGLENDRTKDLESDPRNDEILAMLTEVYEQLIEDRNNWLLDLRITMDLVTDPWLPAKDHFWTGARLSMTSLILKRRQNDLCNVVEEFAKTATAVAGKIPAYHAEPMLNLGFAHICCNPADIDQGKCIRKETPFNHFWNIFRVENHKTKFTKFWAQFYTYVQLYFSAWPFRRSN